MIGRSSTFGGLLGNVLLVGFVIAGLFIFCREYIAPIIRYLAPGVEL